MYYNIFLHFKNIRIVLIFQYPVAEIFHNTRILSTKPSKKSGLYPRGVVIALLSEFDFEFTNSKPKNNITTRYKKKNYKIYLLYS